MKRKMYVLLAAACLGASSLLYTGCKKDAQASSTTAAATATSTPTDARTGRTGGTLATNAEYASSEITVELTDEGRQAMIHDGKCPIVKIEEGLYRTVPNTGGGTTDPPQPYDPIICDGMTYSQLWADIDHKLANFFSSPTYAALQAEADRNCTWFRGGVSNCGICMMFAIGPRRPCYPIEQAYASDRIKATLYKD